MVPTGPHIVTRLEYLPLASWEAILREVSDESVRGLYFAAIQWLKDDPGNPHVKQLVQSARAVLAKIDPEFRPQS